MTQEVSPIRAAINELDGTFLFLEPSAMDAAIVGLVSGCGKEPVVCYDREKVIQVLMERDGMDRDEAEEFFSFNIEGAYVGEATPMFIESTQSLLAVH
ncbi:hypothetical protein [Burkholderia ubonensis]|uniref:hypothetical protein n=1 Tax=Burkholderia ubonensis TaxID=101571 RepID=UPI00075B81A7|nr:hypothetical protein [Burkholderia ubonensis]KVP16952.1 hypothetical protein WJ84_01370 [Burkholderia ubonensis]KVP39924.1 hypothetical protein WJ87_07000 [Burkholderia ubonensis]